MRQGDGRHRDGQWEDKDMDQCWATKGKQSPGKKSGKHGGSKNDECDGRGDTYQGAGPAAHRSVVDQLHRTVYDH